MNNKIKIVIAAASLLVMGASDVKPGMDPDNPTCPRYPNWSSTAKMELTPVDRKGTKILLAEGAVDEGLPARLRKSGYGRPAVLRGPVMKQAALSGRPMPRSSPAFPKVGPVSVRAISFSWVAEQELSNPAVISWSICSP